MMSERNLKLAEQIAELLDTGQSVDTVQIRQALEKITGRLDAIEGHLFSGHPTSQFRSAVHPSQGTFEVPEAVADGLSDKPGEEKACRFEPTGKPCDHCSMCSALGF